MSARPKDTGPLGNMPAPKPWNPRARHGDPVSLEAVHLRHADAAVLDALDRATTDLPKITAGAVGTLRRIRDAQAGQPGAVGYEALGGAGLRHWCFVHETEPERCECGQGDVIPAGSDRTGEAAVAPDAARRDEQAFLAAARRAAAAVEDLRDIAAAYVARAATVSEQLNTPACDMCAELENPDTGHPYHVEPRTKQPTNLGREGIAPRRRCSWHEAFVRDHGRDAELDETRQHLAGGRVRVRVEQARRPA